ncbi:hypothetical protein T11_10912 [Trichinella zimbabwensis]|uniref:Uncharacterized protein n=2 Tax=Trichinella TaxID=6333 RepID=A0A0V1GDB2_9BILA|nr:hypothetical protein T11_10912 [Trichinella zimbabwensis]
MCGYFNLISLFNNDEIPLCIRSRKCISRGSKSSPSVSTVNLIPFFSKS